MRTMEKRWIGCLGLFIAAFILVVPTASSAKAAENPRPPKVNGESNTSVTFAQAEANPFDPRYYINLVEYRQVDERGRRDKQEKTIYKSAFPDSHARKLFVCNNNALYLCQNADPKKCDTDKPAFVCAEDNIYQLGNDQRYKCKNSKLVRFDDSSDFTCEGSDYIWLWRTEINPKNQDTGADFQNIFLIDQNSTLRIELDREAIQNNHVSGEISIYAYLISGSGDNRPISVENYTVIQEKSATTTTTSLSTSSISDLDSKHITNIKDNMLKMQEILKPIDLYWENSNKRQEMDDAFKDLAILIDNNINESALMAGSYDEEPETFNMSYVVSGLYIWPDICEHANELHEIYQEVCPASGNDPKRNRSWVITPKKAIKIHGLFLQYMLKKIQWDYLDYWGEVPSFFLQDPKESRESIIARKQDELKTDGVARIREMYRYSNPNYLAVYVDHIFRKQVFCRLKDGKIDLSREKLNHGDFLIITVTNKVDDNTSFQFSWNIKITAAGFYRTLDPSIVFVQAVDYNAKYTHTVNGKDEKVDMELDQVWKASPGGSLMWRYRSQENPPLEQFLMPGIGVNLSIIDFDPEQDVELGAAIVISEFNNSIVFGYGWDLSVPDNPDYFFIGFNFLSSINAFQKYGEYYTNYQAKPPGGGASGF